MAPHPDIHCTHSNGSNPDDTIFPLPGGSVDQPFKRLTDIQSTYCSHTYHLHDQMSTNGALLGRLLEARILKGGETCSLSTDPTSVPLLCPAHHIVLLAVHLSVYVIECLAAQRPTAGAANEAIGVIQIAHRLTRLSCSCHLLATRAADAKVLALLFIQLHLLLQLPRQLLNLALCLSRTRWSWRCHIVRQKTLSREFHYT